jgi:hypothetical protein
MFAQSFLVWVKMQVEVVRKQKVGMRSKTSLGVPLLRSYVDDPSKYHPLE